MDRLDPMEEFKSGMMLQTATDVFAGSVGPAFELVVGSKDEPREKQCAVFHEKAVEGLKGINGNLITFSRKVVRRWSDLNTFLANLPKIESLLKHLETNKSLNEGKISVGDLTILALFMASQYFKMENDFNSIVPSAVPIINNLTKNKKLAAQVENGKAVPFCPY